VKGTQGETLHIFRYFTAACGFTPHNRETASEQCCNQGSYLTNQGQVLQIGWRAMNCVEPHQTQGCWSGNTRK